MNVMALNLKYKGSSDVTSAYHAKNSLSHVKLFLPMNLQGLS